MILYILAFAIGFVVGLIYSGSRETVLSRNVRKALNEGKRIIICIDDDATILKKVGDKIMMQKAVTTLLEEEDADSTVDTVRPDQPFSKSP